MPTYCGINGVKKKLKEWPVGIGGVVKQQKEVWAGVSGVGRKIFEKDELVTVTYHGSSKSSLPYAFIEVDGQPYYGTPQGSIQIKKGTSILVTVSSTDSVRDALYIEFNGKKVGTLVTATRMDYTFSCLSDVDIVLDYGLTFTPEGYYANYGSAIITGGT